MTKDFKSKQMATIVKLVGADSKTQRNDLEPFNDGGDINE